MGDLVDLEMVAGRIRLRCRNCLHQFEFEVDPLSRLGVLKHVVEGPAIADVDFSLRIQSHPGFIERERVIGICCGCDYCQVR